MGGILVKTNMRHNQSNTFKVESLLDKEGEYVGIFDAKTGLLIGHEGTLVKTNLENEAELVVAAEIENKLQLLLF